MNPCERTDGRNHERYELLKTTLKLIDLENKLMKQMKENQDWEMCVSGWPCVLCVCVCSCVCVC